MDLISAVSCCLGRYFPTPFIPTVLQLALCYILVWRFRILSLNLVNPCCITNFPDGMTNKGNLTLPRLLSASDVPAINKCVRSPADAAVERDEFVNLSETHKLNIREWMFFFRVFREVQLGSSVDTEMPPTSTAAVVINTEFSYAKLLWCFHKITSVYTWLPVAWSFCLLQQKASFFLLTADFGFIRFLFFFIRMGDATRGDTIPFKVLTLWPVLCYTILKALCVSILLILMQLKSRCIWYALFFLLLKSSVLELIEERLRYTGLNHKPSNSNSYSKCKCVFSLLLWLPKSVSSKAPTPTTAHRNHPLTRNTLRRMNHNGNNHTTVLKAKDVNQNI